MILVMNKSEPAARSSDFVITRMITDRIGLQSVLLLLLIIVIISGNRTEWSSIRSVIIRVITKSDDQRASDLFITSIITDRIGRHQVLLPISQKNYNFRGKNSQVMNKGENSH